MCVLSPFFQKNRRRIAPEIPILPSELSEPSASWSGDRNERFVSPSSLGLPLPDFRYRRQESCMMRVGLSMTRSPLVQMAADVRKRAQPSATAACLSHRAQTGRGETGSWTFVPWSVLDQGGQGWIVTGVLLSLAFGSHADPSAAKTIVNAWVTAASVTCLKIW